MKVVTLIIHMKSRLFLVIIPDLHDVTNTIKYHLHKYLEQ